VIFAEAMNDLAVTILIRLAWPENNAFTFRSDAFPES